MHLARMVFGKDPTPSRCDALGHDQAQLPAHAQDESTRQRGATMSRVLGSVVEAIGRECNSEITHAVSGAIRKELLAPVLQQVSRDLMPYAWAIGGVLLSLLLLSVVHMVLLFLIVRR